MAGSSSGWFKSKSSPKGKIFISHLAVARDMIGAGDPAAFLRDLRGKLTSENPGIRGGAEYLVEILGDRSAPPSRQALPAISIVPQRSKKVIADLERRVIGEITDTLKDKENLKYYRGREQLEQATPAAVIRQVKKNLNRIVAGSNISINIPGDAILGQILTTGFKNQHATGTSRGLLNPKIRMNAEGKMFGIPQGLPADAYPIYGLLTPKNPPPRETTGSRYGGIKVIFKDSVRARTTITVGDSLDSEYHPQPIDRAGLASIGNHQKALELFGTGDLPIGKALDWVGYVEVQIHGRTTADDIDRVIFTAASKPSKVILDRLKILGIPYIIEGL